MTEGEISSKLQTEKEEELSLISNADIVISVSDEETKVISQLNQGIKDVYTMGHVMDTDHILSTVFEKRRGILFLGSFHNEMFYNGDAIWFFLREVYPLVIKDSTEPIPLTIAGRGIPTELRSFVMANEDISKFVTFLESPRTTEHLFEEHRIMIAPHLYGAGIQYKVSKCGIHFQYVRHQPLSSLALTVLFLLK